MSCSAWKLGQPPHHLSPERDNKAKRVPACYKHTGRCMVITQVQPCARGLLRSHCAADTGGKREGGGWTVSR